MSIFKDIFLLPFKVAMDQAKKASNIVFIKKGASAPIFQEIADKNMDGKIIDEK